MSRQYRYTLKTVWASTARRHYRQARRAEFAAKHAVYAKIAASVDGLMFDYAAAKAYVAGIKEDSRRLHRQAVLESLMVGEILWAIDRQGRNYTVLVSVPRDIRVFFSWQGKPLWVVDVGSCQPMLHALLYPADCAEKAKYLAAVDDGLWAFLVKAAGVAADLEDEEAKAAIKEDIFQQVFYSYHEGKRSTKGIYANAFEREFPVLWAEIKATKKKHGPKQSSGLAREMQRTEAWAVFDAINALQEKPYPLISIHDAIATTEEGVVDVVAAMAAAFLPLGLKPQLAAKILRIT